MSEIEFLRLKVKCIDLEKENEDLKKQVKELQHSKPQGLEKHLVDLDTHIDKKLASLEIRNAEFKAQINELLKQKNESIIHIKDELVKTQQNKFEELKQSIECVEITLTKTGYNKEDHEFVRNFDKKNDSFSQQEKYKKLKDNYTKCNLCIPSPLKLKKMGGFIHLCGYLNISTNAYYRNPNKSCNASYINKNGKGTCTQYSVSDISSSDVVEYAKSLDTPTPSTIQSVQQGNNIITTIVFDISDTVGKINAHNTSQYCSSPPAQSTKIINDKIWIIDGKLHIDTAKYMGNQYSIDSTFVYNT